ESPLEPHDPILLGEATLVTGSYERVPGMPVTVELADTGVLAVIGDHEDAVSTVRSLLLQLTTHHSPDEVMVAAAFGPEQTEAWRGVDLLPHAQDPELFDGPVPARRVAPDAHSLGQVLGQTLTDRLQYMHSLRRGGIAVAAPPHLVVVLDSHGERAAGLPLTAAPAEL